MISRKRKVGFRDTFIEKSFFVAGVIGIISLTLITLFVFINGIPGIMKVGLEDFIFGRTWKPTEGVFGIFPMIAASFIVTLLSVAAATLSGLSSAIFLAEIAPKKFASSVRTAINVLAGIPSVVYGLFGLIAIVPLIRTYIGGPGNSMLAAVIILTAMIIPTVVTISESAIRSVPSDYKTGSLALGASEIQTVFKVILPTAKSGIFASVVLATGRAIGETMAVILVAGNTPLLPSSVTDPIRTMTANIAMEMGYAGGIHREMLFATGIVLFIFIMMLNVLLNSLNGKKVD